MSLFSVGHSTRSADELGAILRDAHIDVLVDVRTHPTSKWEQHRIENMQTWLPRDFGVAYVWRAELGGWLPKHAALAPAFAPVGVDVLAYGGAKFPKHHIGPDRPFAVIKQQSPADRPSWTNQGLYDYSWFTSLAEFQYGVTALINDAHSQNIAFMCAEALWWKCHRSMISDCLVYRGTDVVHLPGVKPHSAMMSNRLDRYDPRIIKAWERFK